MMIKWIEKAIFQPGCTPLTALIIYLLAFDVLMQSGRIHYKTDADLVFSSQSGWPGQMGCREEIGRASCGERV